jgi:hypothetical protein
MKTGEKHSPETRKKISEAVQKAYDEGRLINWNTGNPRNLPPCFEGKHHSEESKKMISEHRKGKALGNKNAEGHIPHNKGKKHPVHNAEWRRKTSEANSGPNHWNWQGGIASENRLMRNSTRHKDWSLAVLRRDRWRCQKCGSNGRDLTAHHVEPWSKNRELRFEVSNGITLCRACHCGLHKPRTGTGKPPKPRN